MAVDGLKKVLGLPEITFIAIGMTIGGGIFVFTGYVLKIAGPAMPLAYALAWIPMLISMLPLAMLGSALPTTGGNYRYPSRMVSPGLAFTGIWIYALATFFGQIPLYSIACANYVAAVFPNISPLPFAAGLVTFLCALLYYGSQGVLHFDAARFEGISHTSAGSLFLGTALLTFTYMGSNGIIELGDEIRNPGKVIPRALLITFPVVACTYLLVAFTTVNATPWQTLVGVDEPVINTARLSLSQGGFMFFILGGAVLALITTLNALLIVMTKSLLVIVGDGLLPAKLGAINKKYGTAHYLFLLIWVISMAGLISGFSLETFANYSALGGIIIFIPVLLAALRLPKQFPREYLAAAFKLKGFWLYFCPLVGILVGLFFSAAILSDLKSLWEMVFFLVFSFSGLAYYLLRARFLGQKGQHPARMKNARAWVESSYFPQLLLTEWPTR